jgi:hypothetical protein
VLRLALGGAVLLALVSCLGCASTAARPEPSSDAGGRPIGDASIRQSLYRLTYDGGEGRTTLKVVLRLDASGRFQMVFSDLAGRRVWSLDSFAERSILVDHRNSTYCVSGPELQLPAVHPMELPLAAIPRVLAGQLPVSGEAASGGDFVDDAGRRWRASFSGDALESWVLLDDQGPSLWWQADREGGILSRRGGEQYRWSLVVSESSDEPLRDLVPVGFEEGECDG